MPRVAQIFHSLEGAWNFSRVISNGTKVIGTARFQEISIEPPTLSYKEEGTLITIDGQEHIVSKEYRYCLIEGKIEVCFHRTPFPLLHRLDFLETANQESTLIALGDHQCEKDTYSGTYEFIRDDFFKLSYQVKGPDKDYSMTTTFNRQNR